MLSIMHSVCFIMVWMPVYYIIEWSSADSCLCSVWSRQVVCSSLWQIWSKPNSNKNGKRVGDILCIPIIIITYRMAISQYIWLPCMDKYQFSVFWQSSMILMLKFRLMYVMYGSPYSNCPCIKCSMFMFSFLVYYTLITYRMATCQFTLRQVTDMLVLFKRLLKNVTFILSQRWSW